MSRMNAQIDITAKNKTQKAFDSVTRNLGSLNKAAAKTVKRTAKIGVAFATAGAAATAAMVKMRLSAIDNLAKTADKLGVTTEALAGLQHAAELTGVGTDTMNMALQRMTRRVAEAAVGTGEAKGALEELNINAAALAKLPLDQQMQVVADAMQGVEKQSDRVRLAMKLFDSEGVALVNTLAGGSDGLKQMAAEAEKLGISLSRVDAAQIEQANDNVTRAKGVFEGLANQVTVALSPAISELAANFYQTALDTEGFGNIGNRVAELLVKGFGVLADAIHGIKILIKAIQLVFARFTQTLLKGFAEIGDGADFLIRQYNKVAEFFGMGTIEDNIGQSFRNTAEEFRQMGDTFKIELAEMAEAPPSDAIEQWFDGVQAKARETAEVIAANAPAVVAAEADAEIPPAVTQMDPVIKARMEGEQALQDFKRKSTMEQTQIVLGGLNQQLAGIAKHNKAAFRLQQGVQIAQAVMNTYTGATKALASFPPPINFAMAAAVVASGLAQVAQIRSQSFEGGGFTGMGARAGGIDGKGGFPAILHPNESVIDHTKGGGERVIVQQTINVTTGIQQTVRAEIANMLPAITEAAKAAVADSRMRGGGYSRAMGV